MSGRGGNPELPLVGPAELEASERHADTQEYSAASPCIASDGSDGPPGNVAGRRRRAGVLAGMVFAVALVIVVVMRQPTLRSSMDATAGSGTIQLVGDEVIRTKKDCEGSDCDPEKADDEADDEEDGDEDFPSKPKSEASEEEDDGEDDEEDGDEDASSEAPEEEAPEEAPVAKDPKDCSKAGDDCMSTQCCAEPGMQCYTKDDSTAMCKEECIEDAPDPTDEDPTPWKCGKLGERQAGVAKQQTDDVKLAPWVKKKCSKPGFSCSKSKCCAWGGTQCFEKAPGKWATCTDNCYPDAPHLEDVKYDIWACKKLGYRTPGKGLKPPEVVTLKPWIKEECSKPGEDCSKSKCCAWEGMQCFKKNEKWASCKATCVAGPDLLDVKPDKWTCEALGPKTPGKGLAPQANPKLPKWVGSYCAKLGADCSKSWCCQAEGMQCYQKEEGWATCRPGCTPGPDPTDANAKPWNCKELGPRTPGKISYPNLAKMKPADWVAEKCSKDSTDCSKTMCCQSPGTQCFVKKEGWATCRADCVAGPDPGDADSNWWSCEALGSRTPGVAKVVPIWDMTAPAWVKEKCTKSGSCMKTRCCSEPGLQCFTKKGEWATCRDSCYAGAPDFTDINPDPWECKPLGGKTPGKAVHPPERYFKLPVWLNTRCSGTNEDCSKSLCCKGKGMQCYQKSTYWGNCKASCSADDQGGPWTCEKLGPRTPHPWGKPSLFCVAVSRQFGYEVDLMKVQLREGAGIFACDETAVLCSEELSLGSDFKAIHFDAASVGVSKDGTAGNAQLFMNVWDALKSDSRVKELDWTIKVDPDAVLVPSRLRLHLSPHTGKNVYFKNCGAYTGPDWPMMFGAVEVFSKGAMSAYFFNEEKCKSGLSWASWGEDVYMAKCMDFIGVAAVVDLGLVFDGVCRGYADCGDPSAAAFHPFKSEGGWVGCYQKAMR